MIVSCRVEELERHRGAVHALEDGSIDAICVEGVYSAAVCAAVLTRLEEPPLSTRRSPREHEDPSRPQVEVLGVPVSPSMLFPDGPDPATYFGAAEGFASEVVELFSPSVSFPSRAAELLSTLFDREVRRPGAGEGRAYGAATVRYVPVGCGLDLHRENLYSHIPVYEPLRELAALDRVMSAFLVLQAPQEGGELRIFGREEPGITPPQAVVQPPAGTLVVFAGGPRFHDVSRVRGDVARWTIGGFAVSSRDGERAYFWA